MNVMIPGVPYIITRTRVGEPDDYFMGFNNIRYTPAVLWTKQKYEACKFFDSVSAESGLRWITSAGAVDGAWSVKVELDLTQYEQVWPPRRDIIAHM